MLDRSLSPAGFWLLRLRTPGLPGLVNCYLVGHRLAILVDPGSDFRGELERLLGRSWELRGRGGVLQMVLLTHHHPDHTAGADRLAGELGVPVAAHPLTLARLPARSRRWTLPLEEGARLALDEGRGLEVLHTPGHAAGHLCLFEPVARVLLAGDMVPGRGTTLIDPGEGEMAVYLASLRRLLALRPRALLPGHGPIRLDATRAIEEIIAHRLWREQRVLAALEARPRSLAEITRVAYADLSPLRWPLAVRSTLAHLIKLERERRAGRHGADGWSGSEG